MGSTVAKSLTNLEEEFDDDEINREKINPADVQRGVSVGKMRRLTTAVRDSNIDVDLDVSMDERSVDVNKLEGE